MQQIVETAEQATPALPLLTEEAPQEETLLVHPQRPLAPRRQIISRKRSIIRKVQAFFLQTGAYGFSALALVCVVWAVMFLCLIVGMELWGYVVPTRDWMERVPFWQMILRATEIVFLPFLISAFLFYKVGKAAGKRAIMLDTVLLAQSETADLPASDSLVRASSEPVQAQQAVLLRAAAPGQERFQEQLMRPSGRPELEA